MMMSSRRFRPDWASSPGDTIADILGERDMSVVELAHLLEQTPEDASDLLQGRATITIALARRLTEALGASVEFWMSRDYQYRQDSSRLQAADEEWLRDLPVGDMIKYGWLSPPRPSDEVAACLAFFGLPSVGAWRESYAGLRHMAVFRTSPSFDSRPASVAAWLRQGEIEAERIECRPWDATRFRESLAHIRSLTRTKDPGRFLPELQQRCAESGVAVVVVRAPSGCRASGAIRFLALDKAVLQLTFRYRTDDHFWFTFFHEAGHLLLHGERNYSLEAFRGERYWILEGIDALSMRDEQEANDFAANVLIPPDFQAELSSLSLDSRAVIRFAVRAGVSPGIVVGQLQYLGKIGYDQLNGLKRRFSWHDDTTVGREKV